MLFLLSILLNIAYANDYQKGRLIYNLNCVSCHNTNPSLVGSMGPEIAGSSLKLLESRLIDGSYPKGYVPKRKSAMMPKFLNLKNDIYSLFIFLNEEYE